MAQYPILVAPPRFAITIVGSTASVFSRHNLTPSALPHHLSRLLLGQPVSQVELERFGLALWVEWDPDAWPTIVEAGSARPSATR